MFVCVCPQTTFTHLTFLFYKVEFQRQRPNEDGSSSSKSVKRTLFGRNNAYPIKKVMTFNKHNNDFNFGVSYGDLDFLDPEHRK